jgi:hypothetical protein
MFPVLRVVTTLAVLAGGPYAVAGFVLPPPPVGPYRLAFVTSMGTAATSTDIAYYNGFVTDAATDEPSLAALPTTWKVIGSTDVVSATANTMTDPFPAGDTGVPIYRLDGVKIADHYDDLWDGTLDATLSVTETGSLYSGSVWTGTTFDGQGDAGSELGAEMPFRGSAASTSFLWVADDPDDPDLSFRLYGISGELMGAAVPEPSAFLCVGCMGGLLGVGSLSWKKLKSRRYRGFSARC